MAEPRLKIAVFIDFDNIEIGVKTTLGGRFDPGAVLEAIKERGEVVTKIAYGDWTRAGDYSRELTQHGIQMVQRSLTPGGDKNGADVNLALDALELAFTHSHINAFVIVGGDSDFMALVEKLKQYDRKVIVVGGRQFTSTILQRNCHEFIAYENVTRDRRPGARRGSAKPPAEAMPLVKRALKILADREVSPQLGVLKSTLLQLDPTFSEREFGVSSFRDFAERLARGGHVKLRGADRSLHVELVDGLPAHEHEAEAAGPEAAEPVAADAAAAGAPRDVNGRPSGSQAEAFAILRETFLKPGLVQRWPLYVRQVKQLLRAAQDGFDERRYGFAGIVEALRYAQREGLFRLDRDRQGVIRVYPGALLQQPAVDGPADREADAAAAPGQAEGAGGAGEPAETPAPSVQPVPDETIDDAAEEAPARTTARGTRTRQAGSRRTSRRSTTSAADGTTAKPARRSRAKSAEAGDATPAPAAESAAGTGSTTRARKRTARKRTDASAESTPDPS